MILKKTVLQKAWHQLEEAGVDDAQYEARRLLCWALECDLTGLLACHELPEPGLKRFEEALRRRLLREPMAFITGEVGFWALDFMTSPHTLIPRADSEVLIEALLTLPFERQRRLSMLDLGTGTGCLLLSSLYEFPNAWGIGVDLVPGAAQLARRNAQSNGLAERSCFVVSDWGAALHCGSAPGGSVPGGSVPEPFNIVLSNPPYIERRDLGGLMPEVARYEPLTALDGGDDGLDAYRIVCASLPGLVATDGFALLEMGIDQIDAVVALAKSYGLKEVSRHRDLNGVWRALVLTHCRKSVGGPHIF